jgi:hypothetical protein
MEQHKPSHSNNTFSIIVQAQAKSLEKVYQETIKKDELLSILLQKLERSTQPKQECAETQTSPAKQPLLCKQAFSPKTQIPSPKNPVVSPKKTQNTAVSYQT